MRDAYEDTAPVDEIPIDEVDGDLMRELLLSEIASMRARQKAGKKIDTQALESLVELMKDFPALSKAVNELQEAKHVGASGAAGASEPAPATVVRISKLKAVLGK